MTMLVILPCLLSSISLGEDTRLLRSVDGLCNDDCRYHRDGECDDSGPTSEGSACKLGSDCTDCGVRNEAQLGALLCSNHCRTASDGQCDDGGAGSQYKTCTFGDDCADCGHRATGKQCDTDNMVSVCGNDCIFASDGHCDDGGAGHQYSSCSLGSDCVDCGSRKQPCTGEHGEDSYDDAGINSQSVAPPPPPSPSPQCSGGKGRKVCDMSVCSVKMQINMCQRCECAACAFCSAPSAALAHMPPPPLPMTPAPLFSCDMLEGRQNVRLSKPSHWCYTLPLSKCTQSYTFDAHSASAKTDLRICYVANGRCEAFHVPEDRYQGECAQQHLYRQPVQHPPSLPPPLPSRPPPPRPIPCIPISGKCGERNVQHLQCCQPMRGAVARCYQKDEHVSQCRTECVRGWACDESSQKPSAASPSVIEVSMPPPSSISSPLPTPPSTIDAFTRVQTPLVPDPCGACRIVDPSGVGTAWRIISADHSPNGCYTYHSAAAIFNAGVRGHWPGDAEYTLTDLPDDMLKHPSQCYLLPKGIPCFESPGKLCMADVSASSASASLNQSEVVQGEDMIASSWIATLSTSVHIDGFDTSFGTIALGVISTVVVLLWGIIRVCTRLSTCCQRAHSGHEQIPAEEPCDIQSL